MLSAGCLALYPHAGNWRPRYRDGRAFNYSSLAFGGPKTAGSPAASPSLPSSAEFLQLAPANLILSALKKAEDDDALVRRFYEAKGRAVNAGIRLFSPSKEAWKTNLIEEDPGLLTVSGGGSVRFAVKPWEIVTLKVAV